MLILLALAGLSPDTRLASGRWQVSGITTFVSGAPQDVSFTQTGTTDITGSPTDDARVVLIAPPPPQG